MKIPQFYKIQQEQQQNANFIKTIVSDISANFIAAAIVIQIDDAYTDTAAVPDAHVDFADVLTIPFSYVQPYSLEDEYKLLHFENDRFNAYVHEFSNSKTYSQFLLLIVVVEFLFFFFSDYS